jgi:hypothetical protein
MSVTTFILPSIRRPTLQRAINSVAPHPYKVGYDDDRGSRGSIRMELIQLADTPWVSMLDDDDSVTCDYVQRLEEEIAAHPDAGCIIFRQWWLRGQFIPVAPEVEWGNIGISFSVKRDIALAHPMRDEPHEDLHFIERLQAAGVKLRFSPYITYRVRH